ncbi:hypothetical protein ACFQ1E_17135 [Sphingomonas canadensis]|uniref:MobA-like NTP transferase domain-containing protein n=1 Tax=Sphingomonas canadensis TaxID=1219257 RepID=A0ABW3H9A5_9SPHN|nr:hypothetical protein [Sphingomonas canadensis]MCW3837772.1 hypothetical protein [Sphingomonas canadensis]
MLAGLIFAIEEAEDRPGMLAATLPFGGMTLLEYQVRLLAGAGAEQVMVAVGRMTPQLVSAVNRASRPGVSVEIVRSAEEASERLDYDTRVVVLADGLVTTDSVIDSMASEHGEALLVTNDPNSPAAIERLDMRDSWAGIARVSGGQLGEIAQMPEDYDFQSALLRVAVQAGAEHVPLTTSWLRGGHSVELSAAALATRSNAVLAALTERRTSWADRWIFTPIARLALPELTRRGVPGWAPLALGAVLGVAGVALAGWGWEGTGMGVTLAALAALVTAAAHASLTGDPARASAIETGVFALVALATLVLGASERIASGEWTPAVLALVAVAAQLLVERSRARPRRWWSSPSALPLLLAPFAMAGWAVAGLGLAAVYAFATLAAAVETNREKA